MKILIISALFPPDVNDTSNYVKELASRLVNDGNQVELLIYGNIPEYILNVTVHSIPKSDLAIVRMLRFTQSLHKLLPKFDRVIINNGPSVEIPFWLANLLKPSIYILNNSDTVTSGLMYQYVNARLKKGSLKNVTIEARNYLKPEILPYQTTNQALLDRLENDWKNHLEILTKNYV